MISIPQLSGHLKQGSSTRSIASPPMSRHRHNHTTRRRLLQPASQQWRDRFKQQCVERIKLSRQEAINKRRNGLISEGNVDCNEDAWLRDVVAQEWKRFQEEHERAYMAEVGNVEMDNLLEFDFVNEIKHESEYDPILDTILAQEESDLAHTIHAYESTLSSNHPCFRACFRCSSPNIITTHAGGIECASCGLSIDADGRKRIAFIVEEHSKECPGEVLISCEEATGVIALCSVCDVCEAIL
ncbi:uncharacterized protein VTP21DRAFT_7690 [Calcarisporiella thermophila]|uniref:uncharacterized protein n=1 Tax=Calcarisporiella thermophila TaxID=911321 RepID=UPI003742D070